MRVEIDFGGSAPGRSPRRWALAALPLALVALALWWWSGPILETLSPFALAFVFAYLLNPLVDWIAGENRARFRLPRGLALVLLFLAIAVLSAGVLAYMIPALARESAVFAGRVRDDLIPFIKREVRPRLAEWFSARDLISNGAFLKWENDLPTDWESKGEREELGPHPRATGLVVQAASGDLVLRQLIADLVENETHTLHVNLGPVNGSTGKCRIVLRATDEEQGEKTPLFAGDVYPTAPLVERLVFEPGVSRAWVELHFPAGAIPFHLESIHLWKPPPLPYLQPDYWLRWFEARREHFTPESMANVLTQGFRGAGVMAGGAGGLWSWISSTMGGLASLIVYLALLFVITFYMLLDFAAFKRSCSDWVPLARRPRFLSLMGEIDQSLGGFLRGQATICLCVGILVTLFMLLLQVPFAILIGLAAGAFNFIPYLGPAMGMIPAVLLTLFEFLRPDADLSTQWMLIRLALVIGSFLAVQLLDGFFLSPKILAESVDVPPLVVMAALLLGGGIAGVTGMVLAIPVYCILRVLVSEYRRELRRVTEDA